MKYMQTYLTWEEVVWALEYIDGYIDWDALEDIMEEGQLYYISYEPGDEDVEVGTMQELFGR